MVLPGHTHPVRGSGSAFMCLCPGFSPTPGAAYMWRPVGWLRGALAGAGCGSEGEGEPGWVEGMGSAPPALAWDVLLVLRERRYAFCAGGIRVDGPWS